MIDNEELEAIEKYIELRNKYTLEIKRVETERKRKETTREEDRKNNPTYWDLCSFNDIVSQIITEPISVKTAKEELEKTIVYKLNGKTNYSTLQDLPQNLPNEVLDDIKLKKYKEFYRKKYCS